MRSRRGALASLLALALSLSACDEEPVRYSSPEAIVSALENGGVRCTDLASSGKARLVKESGRCTVGGAEVDVFVFDKGGDLQKWLKFGRLLESELVLGPNWVIRANDDKVRSDIQETLNGERP